MINIKIINSKANLKQLFNFLSETFYNESLSLSAVVWFFPIVLAISILLQRFSSPI